MTDNDTIKLLIAEAHPLLRNAFSIFFKEHLNIEVVGEAADAQETLLLCQQLQPDVVLIGSIPRPASTLTLISHLSRQNRTSKIVVLSSSIDTIPAEKYLEAGASQAVVKEVFASDLLAIIHQAYFKF